MNKAIDIKELYYGVSELNILKGISFSINRGDFCCILGPNGCGKTTLLRNITGNIKGRGEILIEGKNIKNLKSKDKAKLISYVPQNSGEDLEFSVLDMVLMGRAPYLKRMQNETKDDIHIAEEAMKLTNTFDLKERNFKNLSGGEKQRALIARAIAQQTNIMILDEPVSNLDIYHQLDILNTLKGFNREFNMTFVVVLHDINLALQFASSIIIMKEGILEAFGKPWDVVTSDKIKEVFNVDSHIVKNPANGKPYIIPKVDSKNYKVLSIERIKEFIK